MVTTRHENTQYVNYFLFETKQQAWAEGTQSSRPVCGSRAQACDSTVGMSVIYPTATNTFPCFSSSNQVVCQNDWCPHASTPLPLQPCIIHDVYVCAVDHLCVWYYGVSSTLWKPCMCGWRQAWYALAAVLIAPWMVYIWCEYTRTFISTHTCSLVCLTCLLWNSLWVDTKQKRHVCHAFLWHVLCCGWRGSHVGWCSFDTHCQSSCILFMWPACLFGCCVWLEGQFFVMVLTILCKIGMHVTSYKWHGVQVCQWARDIMFTGGTVLALSIDMHMGSCFCCPVVWLCCWTKSITCTVLVHIVFTSFSLVPMHSSMFILCVCYHPQVWWVVTYSY